jgi:hypothetical protein
VQELQRQKVVPSPEEIKDAKLNKPVLEDLRSVIRSEKRKRNDKSREIIDVVTASVSGPSVKANRNCVGNIAESFQDLGYSKLVRHFFESSHRKGPQDVAGGLLKNQADMAVVRGKAEIRRARDLCNFSEAKLKTTRSHNCKRRIFKYIEEVERNNKSFQPIRGIRAIHRIETLDLKRVLIRNLSCYCESCIAADGVEPCLNLAQVGNSDETVLT